MSNDDAEARKARADRLRKRIAKVLHPEAAGDEAEQSASESCGPQQESPRDFIHRRMRELKKSKSSKGSSR